MKLLKYSITLCIICFSCLAAHSQYQIKQEDGYTPQIGVMVDMLEDLRERITEMTKDLTQEETDFLFDESANSIGAIIMHLASTEAYYQIETLQERSWTEEDEAKWGLASELGDEQRQNIKGKPIEYYLEMWAEIRSKSLEQLKERDDEWFDSDLEEGVNYHFVWYHVLEHSANHMGQIALIKNRMKN